MTELKRYALLDPITHDGEQLRELVLARPSAGHMRGFSFKDDLEDLDADKLLPILARLCVKPKMSEADLDALSVRDYLEITGNVIAFLSNQSDWMTKGGSMLGPTAQSAPQA